MKRLLILILALICLLAISGCNGKESVEGFSATTAENPHNKEEIDPTDINDWTEQQVTSMFINSMDDSWNIIDCILVPDYAYNRIGALLYWDSEKETTNVAFIDADGFSQSCGVYAKTYSNAGFTYLGNGKVAFVLESQDGETYNCNITLSVDSSYVHFTVENALAK